MLLPPLRPLYEQWFRVEVRGIENIPAEGGALVVANHSGTVPVDGLMTQVAIHDEHPAHRHLRLLGADLVFKIAGRRRRWPARPAPRWPATRTPSGCCAAASSSASGPRASRASASRSRERYKLQRFGRGGFVSAALRTGVPIIPCSIVGAEEIYPMVGNIHGAGPAARPALLPDHAARSRCSARSGWSRCRRSGSSSSASRSAPTSYDAGAADDPMLVFNLTDQVRETIQQTLYSLLMQRRSVFF